MPRRDKPGESRQSSDETLFGAKSERMTVDWWRSFGLLADALARGAREAKCPGLGGCAGRLQRTCLYRPNSLITGKIQGISIKMPLPACPNPLEHETSLDELPAIVSGNFSLRTGKAIRPNSEFEMSAYGTKRTYKYPLRRQLLTHSGARQRRTSTNDWRGATTSQGSA